MYDARWAPTHPAVFATADGSGFLDVWDANEDTEVISRTTHPQYTHKHALTRTNTHKRAQHAQHAQHAPPHITTQT